MTTNKGSLNTPTKSMISSDFPYDINNLNCEELHDLVRQVKKNPIEPFKFLSHVLDDFDEENRSSFSRTATTDIDLQLASLIKRIEINVSLLERTNQRVKDINFIAEKNKILASRELNYKRGALSQIDEYGYRAESIIIEHPEIDQVQRTMKDTLKILECMKKFTIGDLDSKKLSSELFNKLELESNSIHSGSIQLKSP